MDAVILKAMESFVIPFITLPHPRSSSEKPVFSAEWTFCDTKIVHLLQKGTLPKVGPSDDQFFSFFFLIKKSSSRMRFILNLTNLNLYITFPHTSNSKMYSNSAHAIEFQNGFHRSRRCLSADTHPSFSSEIFTISVEVPVVRVYISSFRPFDGILYFYKNFTPII